MLLLPLQLTPGSPAVEAPENVGPFSIGPRFQEVLHDVQHQMASGASPPDSSPPSLAGLMARLLAQADAPSPTGDAPPTAPIVLPDGRVVVSAETPGVEFEGAFQKLATDIQSDLSPLSPGSEGLSSDVVVSEDPSSPVLSPVLDAAPSESTVQVPTDPLAAPRVPARLVGDSAEDDLPGGSESLNALPQEEGKSTVSPRVVSGSYSASNASEGVEALPEAEWERPDVRPSENQLNTFFLGAQGSSMMMPPEGVIAPEEAPLEEDPQPETSRFSGAAELASSGLGAVVNPQRRAGLRSEEGVSAPAPPSKLPASNGTPGALNVAILPSDLEGVEMPAREDGAPTDASLRRGDTAPIGPSVDPSRAPLRTLAQTPENGADQAGTPPAVVLEPVQQNNETPSAAGGNESDARPALGAPQAQKPIVQSHALPGVPQDRAVDPPLVNAAEGFVAQDEVPARQVVSASASEDAHVQTRVLAPSDGSSVQAVSQDGPGQPSVVMPVRDPDLSSSPTADGVGPQSNGSFAIAEQVAPTDDISANSLGNAQPQPSVISSASSSDPLANAQPQPVVQGEPTGSSNATLGAGEGFVVSASSNAQTPSANVPIARSESTVSRSPQLNVPPAVSQPADTMAPPSAAQPERPIVVDGASRMSVQRDEEAPTPQVERTSVSDPNAAPFTTPSSRGGHSGQPSASPSAGSTVDHRAPMVSEPPVREAVEASRPAAAPVDPGVRTERPAVASVSASTGTGTSQAPVSVMISDTQTSGEGSAQDTPDRKPRAPIMATRAEPMRSQEPFDALKHPQVVDPETPPDAPPVVVGERANIESRMPDGVSVRPDVRIDASSGASRAATDAPATLPDDATPDQLERNYRVTDQIIRSAQVFNRTGGSQVTLRLDPPELGEVTIRLSSRDQMVSGEITVENQKVHDIVTRHMGHLREALNGQGVQLDQIDVSVDQRGAQADREAFREALGDPSGGAQDGRRERPRASETWTAPESQPPSGIDGRVDFVA